MPRSAPKSNEENESKPGTGSSTRPSATVAPDPSDSTKTVPAPYNAANSGGSNLGPTNKALVERVNSDVQKLAAKNPGAAVPIDLVTTTASGLDPHISPAAALFQVPRVARTRNLPQDRLRQLVNERFLGLLGEPRVNGLRLIWPSIGPPPADICRPVAERSDAG